MSVQITNDRNLLQSLGSQFDDGIAYIVVPAAEIAVGPLQLPEYLGFQLGTVRIPELVGLISKLKNPP